MKLKLFLPLFIGLFLLFLPIVNAQNIHFSDFFSYTSSLASGGGWEGTNSSTNASGSDLDLRDLFGVWTVSRGIANEFNLSTGNHTWSFDYIAFDTGSGGQLGNFITFAVNNPRFCRNHDDGNISWSPDSACGNADDIHCGNIEENGITEYHIDIQFLLDQNEVIVFLDNVRTCNASFTVDPFDRFQLASFDGFRMDNIIFQEGQTTEPCSEAYPMIRCDDFQYSTSLSSNWTVLNTDASLNTTFSPDGNLLNFNSFNPASFGYYSHDSFPVEYAVGLGQNITRSLDAPVFTIEFDLQITTPTSDDSFVALRTWDNTIKKGIDLMFEWNGSQIDSSHENENSDSIQFSNNTFSNDSQHKIKAVIYFGNRNKTLWRFNSSEELNIMDVFIDGVLIGDDLRFPDLSQNTNRLFIVRDANSTIDNFKHYVGTDPNTANIVGFYSNLFFAEDITEVITTATTDLIPAIESIWEDWGLKTTSSRILAGLFMLFILAMTMIMNKVPIAGTLLVMVLASIFLVIIGLFPVWILVLIILFGAIAGAMAFKAIAGG